MVSLAIIITLQADAALRRSRKPQPQTVQEVNPVQGAVEVVKQNLEDIVDEAAEKIVTAIMVKINAFQQVALKKISSAELAVIIGQQDIIINKIERDLPKTVGQAGLMGDESEEVGYLGQFVTSIKNYVIAGHGSTVLQKYLASAIIAKLEKKKKLTNNLAIKTQLDNEISKQKIITGEAWSTERQAFWAGAITLAALGGLTYLGGTLEETKAVPIPTEPTPEIQPSVWQGWFKGKRAPVTTTPEKLTSSWTDWLQRRQALKDQKLEERIAQQADLETQALLKQMEAEKAPVIATQPAGEETTLTEKFWRLFGYPTKAEIVEQQIAQQTDLGTQAIIEQERIEKQALDVQNAQQYDALLEELNKIKIAEEKAAAAKAYEDMQYYQKRRKELDEQLEQMGIENRDRQLRELWEGTKKVGKFIKDTGVKAGTAIYEKIKEQTASPEEK